MACHNWRPSLNPNPCCVLCVLPQLVLPSVGPAAQAARAAGCMPTGEVVVASSRNLSPNVSLAGGG